MIRIGLARPAPSSGEPFAAWVLDLLGCVSTGRSELAALEGVPEAIDAYLEHARELGAIAPNGDVDVVERFEGRWEGDYEVNAFFRQADLAPATAPEVSFATALLDRTRAALLAAASEAGPGGEGDRDVDDVLRHVAKVEWWYGTRLDEVPQHEPAGANVRDAHELLAEVRGALLRRFARFPALGAIVRGHQEERWTARKILRRAIYHELDHVLELERRVIVGVS
jgi:predicted RNase H-like HicB family nuclease